MKRVLKKCIICGKEFLARTGQICCSEECRRKRNKKLKKEWYKTFRGKLCAYRQLIKQNYKNKSKEFLILRLHQSLEKIDVINEILKKKYGIDLIGGGYEFEKGN